MHIQEAEVSRLLTKYGEDVRLAIQLLEARFTIPDAIQVWRRKKLDRVGFLDTNRTIQYAMHGAGCTVEFGDGKLVSFELDETGYYRFDPWKFKLYTDSIGIDYDLLDDHYIKLLAKHTFYRSS